MVDIDLFTSTMNLNTKQKSKILSFSANAFTDVEIHGGFNQPLSIAFDCLFIMLLLGLTILQVFCFEGILVTDSISTWGRVLLFVSPPVVYTYWIIRKSTPSSPAINDLKSKLTHAIIITGILFLQDTVTNALKARNKMSQVLRANYELTKDDGLQGKLDERQFVMVWVHNSAEPHGSESVAEFEF